MMGKTTAAPRIYHEGNVETARTRPRRTDALFFFFGDEEWGDLSIMFSASKRAFRRGIFFPGTPLREAFRYCWVIQDLDY